MQGVRRGVGAVMRGRGSTAVAALLACVASMSMVLANAGSAAAEEPVAAADMGWYTSTSLMAGGVPIGDPLATSTLTSGDLPVGANAQEEHKRSYVRLDIPAGATEVVIELPLSDSSATNFGVAGPILACGLLEPFFVTGGGDLAEAPEVDCSNAVVGEPNAELASGESATAYIFDLTPLLPHWESMGEAGIGLVADVTEPQGFYQLTFRVQLFGVVGTAEVAEEAGGGTGTQDPITAPSSEDPAPLPGSSTPPANEPFAPPVSVGGEEPFPGVTEGVQPPVVADEVPDPDAAPVPGGGQEQPTTPIAAPGRVTVLPWFVGLLLGGGALAAVGRSLDPKHRPRSSLDELIAP